MDESAEWRRMFDKEAERASKCNTELTLVSFFKLLYVEMFRFLLFLNVLVLTLSKTVTSLYGCLCG